MSRERERETDGCILHILCACTTVCVVHDRLCMRSEGYGSRVCAEEAVKETVLFGIHP